ncbi:MAG: hypothetical protein AAFY32_03660, partial [Pseudomonadota bacterium]
MNNLAARLCVNGSHKANPAGVPLTCRIIRPGINQTLARGCGTFLEWFAFFRNGCEKTFPLWLGDRDYAIWTVAFIGIWQGF